MPFNAQSHLSAEVASQPSDWEAVAARLSEFAARLPSRGARVAVLGSGTSYYMAQAYAARREFSGHGETDAFAASEHRLSRDYDAVLVISRSGTTTEAIDVLSSVNGREIPTTAIVATPGTPVAQLAAHAITLPEVDERSVVQTRFATSTLALLRASLRLAAQVAATGAHFEHRSIDPLAELVGVHRLCLRMARDKDLDPDHPRNLTRSVILDHAHQD